MVNRKTGMILSIIILAISIFLTVGVNTLFHACVHEDSAPGSCHWAQQAIFAAGIILCIQSLVLLFCRERAAVAAMSVSITGTAVITALIPNIFISLCLMPAMRCIAYMRPWTITCCAALAVLNIIYLLLSVKKKSGNA